MSLPIQLIAVAPGMGRGGDHAILEGKNGSLRKVRRSTPERRLKNMLKCYGIADDDLRSDAFVEMVRKGQPAATF